LLSRQINAETLENRAKKAGQPIPQKARH
jgi:hypothetical protein